ncbi:MAG: hypothetical protein M3R71_01735 [Actinomycetota bacterium]|nr:hypothetical protein [Actinomycetota bacterium]
MAIPEGNGFGLAGPDLGYGMKLAKRFVDRLQLSDGESSDDAVTGAFVCGAKRAASLGRAPVIYDFEWAYALWGLLGEAPADLVALRKKLFQGASHHYWDQRRIVDAVASATYKLSPAEVLARLGTGWRQMLVGG